MTISGGGGVYRGPGVRPPSGPRVRSVYDLLRALTQKAFPEGDAGIGFAADDKAAYLAAIDHAEALGVFGNAALRLEN